MPALTALRLGTISTVTNGGWLAVFADVTGDVRTEADLGRDPLPAGRRPDRLRILYRRERLSDAVASECGTTLGRLHRQHDLSRHCTHAAVCVVDRALVDAAPGFLTRDAGRARTRAQVNRADIMTQSVAGFEALVHNWGEPRHWRRSKADGFMSQRHEQVGHPQSWPDPSTGGDCNGSGDNRPLFDWTNPDRQRPVMSTYTMTRAGFRWSPRAGYELVVGWIIRTAPRQPPKARDPRCRRSRIASQVDENRKIMAKQVLRRPASTPDLSPDTTGMVDRILAGSARCQSTNRLDLRLGSQ